MMRRLTLALVSMTLTVAVITSRFLPERCEICQRKLYRMSVLECFWHGHGEHLSCQDCFDHEFVRPFDPL